jgi:hypothetical protein
MKPRLPRVLAIAIATLAGSGLKYLSFGGSFALNESKKHRRKTSAVLFLPDPDDPFVRATSL